MKKKGLAILLLIVFINSGISGQVGSDNSIIVNNANDIVSIGKKIQYFEDKNGDLSISQIVQSAVQAQFKYGTKEIFVQPATSSVFWIKFSAVNNCNEDIWLEIGSTYAWYVDFYTQDSTGQFKQIAETGTMRPEESKFYNLNLFWLPLNKAGQSKPENFYLRIGASLPFELPLHVGTIRALSKERDIGNYLTAGFVGLILIIFLYSLFIYISTKDHIYIWYLGYLLLMGISMPYANSHPFIENLDFLYFDKQWWNNYFIVWHSPVYFFVGMFCIKYLNVKDKLPISYKIIIIEIILLSFVSPLLNIFGLELEKIINAFQVVVLLLYLTCIITAYYMMFKGNKYARFYVLGWTFMIVHVFIFFATVNGFFPYNNFSRNALYFGVGIEVWMFSLALGDRINLIRLEKEQAQEQYIDLVNSQNELLQVKVKERTTRLEDALEEIEAANSELMAQADQLAESNKAKDKLFSIIGHDLKSPIASLKVILKLVASKSIDAKEFEIIAKKFESKIDNVLFLLNNLFQWADTQKNGIITNPSSLMLHKTIIQNLDLLKTNAAIKQIEMVNKVSEDLFVFCDPSQLNVIILNLLNNAIKFTHKNGIILIEAHRVNNEQVQISVKDNGRGMNSKKLKTLFDPYIQDTSEGTEGESGTGLGLTLCKDFIENNGGAIWVESEENIGSTFYFTLPQN